MRKKKPMWREKMALWREKYGEKVLLLGGFLMVGVLAFEAGILEKELGKERPAFVIHEPALIPEAQGVTSHAGPRADAKVAVPNVTTENPSEGTRACVFVGSKNSNKYHLPTTRCAKQIRPENRLCFSDEAVAQAKGYLPGCLNP